MVRNPQFPQGTICVDVWGNPDTTVRPETARVTRRPLPYQAPPPPYFTTSISSHVEPSVANGAGAIFDAPGLVTSGIGALRGGPKQLDSGKSNSKVPGDTNNKHELEDVELAQPKEEQDSESAAAPPAYQQRNRRTTRQRVINGCFMTCLFILLVVCGVLFAPILHYLKSAAICEHHGGHIAEVEASAADKIFYGNPKMRVVQRHDFDARGEMMASTM